MHLQHFLSSFFVLLSISYSCAGFTNPIRSEWGADPTVTFSGDGFYYLLTTSDNDVHITRSTSIEGLKTGESKVVYTSTDASRCCNVWAPEMHWIGDRWYIYFSAGRAADLDGQRSHVLSGVSGGSPWDGFSYSGAIVGGEWAIDGTVLRTGTFGNFFVYSCFNGAQYQSLCIQKLNPDNISVSGAVKTISYPTESWELNAYPVNEGPAALYFGGKTYLAFSASFCWSPSYCLGLLTWDGITDPTNQSAWTKSNGCVLSSANGHYSTGHNSFLTSPNGEETWVVYHAAANPEGACDGTRYTMVQPLGTNSDGSPSFPVPAKFEQVFNEPSS